MNPKILISALALLLPVCSQAAVAADVGTDVAPVVVPAGPKFDFDLTAATNYIFRGISQTHNDPVIFGLARMTWNGFYLTTGAENVDFKNGTHAEYDVSAGWSTVAAGFNLDFGAIRYGYINAPSRIDTVELRFIASHPLGPANVGVAVNHTSNYFGSGDGATYVEGTAALPVIGALSASAALGHQYISDGHGFSTWNFGVGYALTSHWSADLRYYQTEGHASSDLAGNHFVASTRFSF